MAWFFRPNTLTFEKGLIFRPTFENGLIFRPTFEKGIIFRPAFENGLNFRQKKMKSLKTYNNIQQQKHSYRTARNEKKIIFQKFWTFRALFEKKVVLENEQL